MALSNWDPITTVGFFMFLMLVLNYGGIGATDSVFVWAPALFVEIPVLIYRALASNFFLLAPLLWVGIMFYFRGVGEILGDGPLAWILVAWFIVVLAGFGAI